MQDKINKHCKKCDTIKPRTDFYVRRRKNAKSIQVGAYCKPCTTTLANRSKKGICKCGKEKVKKAKQCLQCILDEAKTFTLGDKIYTKHKYARYAYVRYYAGVVGRSQGFCKCMRCGYDQHFEVCHIKAISSFPPETLISEVNDPSNLVALCPNCHWEFDNGLLILK